MNYEKFDHFDCLDETDLSSVNGGGVFATIALVGGVVCAADQLYKFGQGVVEGWNNYK